jgi:UDPglucose 6-dehydrogenase
MPNSALAQNDIQPRVVAEMVRRALDGDLGNIRIALLGLAFKPDTDDVRETRALPIYRRLLAEGAKVVVHDPQAGPNFLALVGAEGLPIPEAATDLDGALQGAKVAVIQTDWSEYRELTAKRLVTLMARPVVVDARRVLDPDIMQAGGVEYHGVGWPAR